MLHLGIDKLRKEPEIEGQTPANVLQEVSQTLMLLETGRLQKVHEIEDQIIMKMLRDLKQLVFPGLVTKMKVLLIILANSTSLMTRVRSYSPQMNKGWSLKY